MARLGRGFPVAARVVIVKATKTASANLNAVATLASARVRKATRSASLNAVATLASAATKAKIRSASLAATATLASARVRKAVKTASLNAVATLSSAHVRKTTRTDALNATATLTSSRVATRRRSATLNAVARLNSTPGNVTLALPVLDFDLTLPAPTIAQSVTLGLPCLKIKLTAPAPYLGTAAPLDEVTATLYDRDGLTRIDRLRTIRGTWREAVNRPGTVDFEVPLDDDTTPEITDRRVVKFRWWRAGVPVAHFACRIRSESAQLAVDGRRWVQFPAQPGLLDFIGDAVIFPEQDIATTDVTTRNFGYMSIEDPWYVPEDWFTPQGQSWADTGSGGSFRNKLPADFRGVDRDAEWISAIDPNTSQPEFSFNYFRASLTVAEDMNVEILYTADNYPSFYVDGELVASWDPPGRREWITGNTATVYLTAGTHVFAVGVQNSRFPVLDPVNPIAWICTVRQLKSDGSPMNAILLHSDTTNWLVTTGSLTANLVDGSTEPGWHRAQVLHTLVQEAKIRGAYGPTQLSYGFTPSHDSDGNAWTDRGQYELDIATTNLVAIAAQLTERGMDVGVGVEDLRLYAWRRQGEDKSASVFLRLGDDGTPGSLLEYQVDSKGVQFNTLLSQLPIKRWMQTDDTDSIAAVGRVEAGLTLADAHTLGSGGYVAHQQLDEGGTSRTVSTVKTSTLDGPIPYVDYDLGDTVSVRAHRNGGWMRARALAFTVDFTADVIAAWPEFVGDQSGG